ncbi:hypothetical protein Tco_0885951 [Tanacetum coccineum]
MYEEVEHMYRYQPTIFSLVIHHGGSFRKFTGRKYREGKTNMFDFVDIDCLSVHELDVMVLQLGYDGINKPMYYHYLRLMTDLDVEHGITKLNCYYMSKSQIRAIIEEYHEDMIVKASSSSLKKKDLLMLKWYDNSTPSKASSNTGSLSGVDSCVIETSDLPKVCSQLGSINQAFKTQEKSIDDVMGDVMRHLSFDIAEIDAHLEASYFDVMHFVGSCHEGLSHDETFRTHYLDPPLPFDPSHVSTDEGIVSDHAKVKDILDKELGNENDVVPFAMVDEHLDNGNAPLENAALIGKDIHSDSDYQDYEVDVQIYLFGLKESNYEFTTIWVSSKVPDNDFMVENGYEVDINDFDNDSGGEGDGPGGRRSTLNKIKKAFMQGEPHGNKYGFYYGEVLVNPVISVKAVQDQLQRELELQISMSFKAGKRELLGLDEAFMKGPNPGQVLSIVGIDANNASNTSILFKKSMDEFKSLNVRDHAWLSKTPAKHWSRAYFSRVDTSGGMFGNQAVRSEAGMVGSQAVGSQPVTPAPRGIGLRSRN